MAPSLLLFSLSSLLAASSVLPPMPAAATAGDGQRGPLCPPAQVCGGVNISFPFAIVPDHATASSCGEIGFQVVCVNSTTPYLGHNLQSLSLQILDIFYDNYSLVVADARKLQIFNTSGNNGSCHISESSNNASSNVGQPFTISPANQNLIIYNCTEAPPPAAREELVETVCGSDTFVRLAREPSNQSAGYYGSYFLEGCNATVVPVLGGHGNVDASNYKELISHGFLLTWSPPPLPMPPAADGQRGIVVRLLAQDMPRPQHHLPEPGGPTCGSPSFQINCTITGAFLVRSVLQAYQVLNIFTHNKSVNVVDQYLPLATGCPAPIANISFPTADLITSKANEELLFLVKCTESKPQNSTGFHSLPCDNSSFVRLGDGRDFSSHSIQGGVPPSCLFVVIPIRWAPGGNGDDYIAAMKNGFLLEWTDVPEDCPRCMESGGECVYSNTGDAFDCNCSGSLQAEVCAGGVVGCVFLVCVVIFLWHKHKREPLPFLLCKKIGTAERNIEALIVSYGSLAPKRYKFSEAIKITSSLNNKLGEGSYGMVFKGKLDDGRRVAVKFLHDSKGEGEEFVNEVMSIGRTSHVNIVGLFGFCLEGSKRALIYEYMPNGSLDRYIYSENPKAPQNILLDQDFHPKIADFGLAKLCRTKESKLSMIGARGTVGFIAPEVHSRTFGVVSTKSDVYSYGMMLLEMVGGRKNVKSVAQKSSENYFPHWIYDHFGQDDALDACEVTSGNEGIAKKMSVIGLWCIQILPMHRPTITKVLEMFERGLNDLDMPPRQNFSQILEDPAYGLNAESSSISNVPLLLPLLVSLLLLLHHHALADCEPATRGNLTVRYPFWLGTINRSSSPCGHPVFEILCSADSSSASLKGSDIHVLDVDYSNNSVVASDTRIAVGDDGVCRADLNMSSSIALSTFTISSRNRALFFLYSCNGTEPLGAGYVNATSNCSAPVFAYLGGSYNWDNPPAIATGRCTLSYVPVLGPEAAAMTAANCTRLLKDGFVLEWAAATVGDCSACSASGGQCRYDSAAAALACHCPDGNLQGSTCAKDVLMGATASLLFPCICVLIRKRSVKRLWFLLGEKTRSTSERNIEALIVSYRSLAPKRYRYSEVVNITSSLNNKLGEGGYGMVYKGRLYDSHLVAVKFLRECKGNGEEFVNEVMSIGRTSHVNIVNLFGFCLESSKRALIYEYMPNGSLDQYIFSENPKETLWWQKLYTVAIGIARGLEYLHHSCNTRIVHFDIKPQNILLDQDFCPKIADFGLTKLCHTKEIKFSVTGARGTIGFIAPGVHSRTFGAVSAKSDVYSYGMMLLEMVGGRKNVKSMVQKSSEKYFPDWIHDHFAQHDGLKVCEVTSEVEEIARKMTLIGLWCIQILPMHRPTITHVLDMFERSLDKLDMPPKQNFSQIRIYQA
ncbi:hypothetical protein U9M48_020669 [Paspalum notatum var. saurae]|uniref:Protein kinase domain-containing protein n=1 Tax=Paspalum notatum var. saurae TaxID=547442 RepID=A0AAQ3TDW6_PASNO